LEIYRIGRIDPGETPGSEDLKLRESVRLLDPSHRQVINWIPPIETLLKPRTCESISDAVLSVPLDESQDLNLVESRITRDLEMSESPTPLLDAAFCLLGERWLFSLFFFFLNSYFFNKLPWSAARLPLVCRSSAGTSAAEIGRH
jgi:hypothetical protein